MTKQERRDKLRAQILELTDSITPRNASWQRQYMDGLIPYSHLSSGSKEQLLRRLNIAAPHYQAEVVYDTQGRGRGRKSRLMICHQGKDTFPLRAADAREDES